MYFEIPKCAGAVDGVEKIFADSIGLYGVGEILHDGPFVNVKLGGKIEKAAGRNNALCQFRFFVVGKIQVLVAGGLLGLRQSLLGYGFHLAGVEIEKGEEFVELHL
jgi:hypothetical protein